MIASAAEVEAAQKAMREHRPFLTECNENTQYAKRVRCLCKPSLSMRAGEYDQHFAQAVADAVVAAAQPRIAAEATHGLADKWNLRANWLGDEAQS